MASFGRKLKCQIGKRDEIGIEISGLKVVFAIDKNDESNANKSKVSIYNLSKDTISKIEESQELYLYVGYESSNTEYLLLYGDIDRSLTRRSGTEIITDIFIEEGKDDLEQSHFSKAYAKKTSKKKIIKDAINSLGLTKIIDEKKIDSVLSIFDGVDEKMENGSAFSKKTKKVLDDFLGLVGLSYSIQNGEFVLLGQNDFVDNEEFIINANNGLIGVPTRTQESKSKNKKKSIVLGCDMKVLLLPELRVGTKIRLESEFIKGIFKVKSFSANGSNYDNSWEMDLKTTEVTTT